MVNLPLVAAGEKPRPPLSAFPFCMRCQVQHLSDDVLINVIGQFGDETTIVPFAADELANRIDRMSAPAPKGGN